MTDEPCSDCRGTRSFTNMTFKREYAEQRRWVLLAVALVASVLVNIIIVFLLTRVCDRTESRLQAKELKAMIIQQATISFGDVEKFVFYLDDAAKPLGGVLAIIPPYACAQCITSSLQQLNELELPVRLFVPDGFWGEKRPTMSPPVSEAVYKESVSQNPLYFYSDLIFVRCRDGRIEDYYLHNKDVPEALAVFLSRSESEREE